jgi:hypothetical protein
LARWSASTFHAFSWYLSFSSWARAFHMAPSRLMIAMFASFGNSAATALHLSCENRMVSCGAGVPYAPAQLGAGIGT